MVRRPLPAPSPFRRRAARLLPIIVLATACGWSAAPAVATTPSPADRPAIAPLATFDSAWTIIARSHWDTTYNGVDWRALRDSLRPRAAAATTQGELRRVLQGMLATLRQSHFDIIPQEVSDAATVADSADRTPRDAQVGLDTRWQDERLLVTRVDTDGPAARAGVRPGWAITRIGTLPVAERLARLPAAPDPRRRVLDAYQLAERSLRGPAGSAVDVAFLDDADRPRTLTLTRTPLAGTEVKFGNLPPQRARLTWERRLVDGRRIGVIRFNLWMTVLGREFDVAMDSLRDSDGLVLDIRGNFGGVAGMAMGIGGHFVDSAVAVGVMATRANTLRFTMNPRRVNTAAERVRPYAGPVALVVDALSVSTSEIFAAGLQELGRAQVVGEQTAGQALPAVAERLPNGDILYHAIADFRAPSGRSIEGEGVKPDELVRPDRASLLAGRDPALDRAVTWAAAARRNGRAGPLPSR